MSFDANIDEGVTTDTSSVSTAEKESTSTARTYETDPNEADPETTRSDSTDEVDVQKLVSEPSLSDIRWLYRNTFAKKIVDKPIEDAFKHGYTIKNDPSGKAQDIINDTNYEDNYKLAQKKARRDGFAVLFFILSDNAPGPHVDPFNTDVVVSDIEKTKVLTIDKLTHVPESEIEDEVPSGYGRDLGEFGGFNYEVRESGIVISRDLDSSEYGDPIGYVLDYQTEERKGRFIHKNRCQHLVWNKEVDGDYTQQSHRTVSWQNGEWLGEWEGDSILQSSYHLVKAVFKGDWAVMQTLFRYSSPFFELTLPPGATQEDLDQARDEFRNMNAKAEGVYPDGFELELHTSDGNLDPDGYFSPIFDQICACHEMTKSVLFGTQQGTVSGSDSDQQNYLNQVDRFRENQAEADMRDFVRRAFRWNQSLVPSYALGFQVDWEPLFKLNALKRIEKLRSTVQAIGQASEQFYIAPNEGRQILDEALEDDFDIDLSEELDKEDFELLEDLQMAQVGQSTVEEKGASPHSGQNGGGNQAGNRQQNSTPQNSADSDEVTYEY